MSPSTAATYSPPDAPPPPFHHTQPRNYSVEEPRALPQSLRGSSIVCYTADMTGFGRTSLFRDISLDEYQERKLDRGSRITMAELENGLIVESYATNSFLELNQRAVAFTAEVQDVNRIQREPFGTIALRLIIYAHDTLAPLEAGVSRTLTAYADPEYTLRSKPLLWRIDSDYPLRTPQHNDIKNGFFGTWADNDLSRLDTTGE